jgi:hypothetical protein
MSSLRDLLNRSQQSIQRTDPVEVIVDLQVSKPTDELINALRRLGLNVEQIIGNKVVGTIESPQLASLREDPRVRDVEVGVRLKPH